jgi:hypothetical protein
MEGELTMEMGTERKGVWVELAEETQ